jgi:hypothetical protein
MSRNYSSTWRPNHSKKHYHNHNNHRREKDWTSINDKADDQIAPTHASHSISSLQRWALATATLPHPGPRANEAQIIERIERRYGRGNEDPRALEPRYSNDIRAADDGEVEEDREAVVFVKRRREDLDVEGEGGGGEGFEKRRRVESEGSEGGILIEEDRVEAKGEEEAV